MRSAFPLLLAAACVFLALFFAVAPMERVLTIVPDDAAYYLGIARHAAHGDGLTFDGINRTNGFQPLWLYALTAFFAVFGGSSETMFRGALVLQIVLLGAAGLLIARTIGAHYRRETALVSGLVFLFFVLPAAANGMESAILVLCLALLFHLGRRWEVFARGAGRRAFAFGLFLGLAILARLDMIFLALSIAAFSLAGAAVDPRTIGERLRRTSLVAAGSALLVFPYLLYNRLSFGAFVPVSGLLKSSFPAISLSGEGLSFLGKAGAGSAAFAAAYLVWFFARRPAGGDGRGYIRAALAAMAAAVIVHLLHAILFMKWAVFGWHFIPYILFASVALCEPLEAVIAARAPGRRRLLAMSAAAAVAAVGLVTAYGRSTIPLDRNWGPASYEAALWARASTPPAAVFAMKDAGNFGYFSERPVINLDGVVNSVAFQRVLAQGKLGAYLREHGVRYLVQHAFWNRPDVLSGAYDSIVTRYTSRRFGSESDEIRLYRVDEAYRSKPYFDGPYETVFIVWKYRSGS